jgi:Helix-turn-helix domain
MPGGEALVQVCDTFKSRERDIPVIEAAQLVVARYVEATAEELKPSRYLFVNAEGGRLERSTIMLNLNRAARRRGICHNFMEASGATFVNAVYQDPDDDGAALVLTGRNLADAGICVRPSLNRLRSYLEQYHPLLGLNRIGFFETERRLSKLATDIRACKELRPLENSERQRLRRQYLPKAVKLFDEGIITQSAAALHFGLAHPSQIHILFKRYRQKGREGLLDRSRGRLTPDWRRKTMELHEKMSPIKSRWAFHRELKKIHFPYGITTLRKFLDEAGEKAPRREMMSQKWRDLVDREFAKLERPPEKKQFRTHLETKFKFPYGRKSLEKYLDATGLLPIRRGRIGGSRPKSERASAGMSRSVSGGAP